MRTLASLPTYLATGTEDGLQIHQYAASSLRAGAFAVEVETDYPWDGRITVTVREAPDREVGLALRIPDWASEATVDGEPVEAATYTKLSKVFRPGDQVQLDLPMPARLLVSGQRVDATRGCVVVARGPLVYAIEQPDVPAGVTLEDIRIDPSAPRLPEPRPDLLDGVVTLHTTGRVAEASDSAYRSYGEQMLDGRSMPIALIPYYAWANRGPHAMRVWIPTQ